MGKTVGLGLGKGALTEIAAVLRSKKVLGLSS